MTSPLLYSLLSCVLMLSQMFKLRGICNFIHSKGAFHLVVSHCNLWKNIRLYDRE